MDELGPLSSQLGERTEAANRRGAAQCLANPALLGEVSVGLAHKVAAVVGDCAEVMTKVAEAKPELVAPHVDRLVPLLGHKTTRVRWEAMHAIALTAHLVPQAVGDLLPRLGALLESDTSTIVRDYATDALGGYSSTSTEAAHDAFPYLRLALTAAGGKHAGRALGGLQKAVVAAPDLGAEIRALVQPFLEHERGVVRKAAGQLVKSIPM